MGSSKKRTRVTLPRAIIESSKKQRRGSIIKGGGAEKTCCPLIMNNVNDDMLIEILVHLPVQSLSRFKSVSKSWCSLIGSPDFIHRHATTEDKSNKLGTFIFELLRPLRDPNDIDKYCSPCLFVLSGEQLEVFKDLGVCPLPKKPRNNPQKRIISLAGSCHGIICLQDEGDVYLWNPANKQFRHLPESLGAEQPDELFEGVSTTHWFVAFGFDVKAKDYKVLKITHFFREHVPEGNICRVQLYSLNTDSWRYIDDPNIHAFGPQALYMNGKCYFKGRKDGFDERIFSFDFGEETFETIWIMEPLCFMKFIGEKAGFIKYLPPANDGDDFEVRDCDIELWVLNDCYGKVSTAKRHSTLTRNDDSLIATSKNGEIGIMGNRNGFKMRNLVTQVDVKELPSLHSRLMVISVQFYKESLVQVERNGLLYDNNS